MPPPSTRTSLPCRAPRRLSQNGPRWRGSLFHAACSPNPITLTWKMTTTACPSSKNKPRTSWYFRDPTARALSAPRPRAQLIRMQHLRCRVCVPALAPCPHLHHLSNLLPLNQLRVANTIRSFPAVATSTFDSSHSSTTSYGASIRNSILLLPSKPSSFSATILRRLTLPKDSTFAANALSSFEMSLAARIANTATG